MQHTAGTLNVSVPVVCRWIALMCVFAGLTVNAADEETSLERLKPLEPAEAAASFLVKEGFSLQLVASEPLVTDPVAGAFDEDGRLFLVEMNDYPYTDRTTDKPNVERTADLPIGKVRLLEDTNDDGVFDRSSIFARNLSWPTGIAVYQGGVFVAATPDVWYLKDADGDGMAEIRQKVFSGFRKFNVQAVVNNLIWGLDHQIYGAGGTNGGKIASDSADPAGLITISRHDFRFSPESRRLELLSGGARFGNTFDDWGNRFICNIRNPIQHVVLPLQYLNRNPSFSPGSPLHDVAVAGDQIRVFRASPPEPWRVINAARLTSQADPRMPRSEKNAEGFMTSACGVTVYRGDAYPVDFRQQVFLSDVAANLIHRQRIVPSGVTFTSSRMDEASEFAASTDTWFRPVNFLHAPDGTLYVLDMYRETIEHPWSMPDDLKALLDLESGRDRGRVYRLAPPEFQRRPTPRLSRASSEELVELLRHPNAWHRETAHRLLFERQDSAIEERLRKLCQESASEVGRLHALYSLQGLSRLRDQDLLQTLKDVSAHLRQHAILLSEPRLNQAQSAELLLPAIQALANDPELRVRFQAALTLGSSSAPSSIRTLQDLARRNASDAWMVTAVLTSSSDVTSGLLPALLEDQEVLKNRQNLPLIRQLGVLTGSRKATAEIGLVEGRLAALSGDALSEDVLAELLVSLDEGLRRSGQRLAGLWASGTGASLLKQQVDRAVSIIQDSSLPPAVRLDAMRSLALTGADTLKAVVEPLLSTAQPTEIQTAAVRALAAMTDDSVIDVLLSVYPRCTPSVQYEVIESLAASPKRIPRLLSEIEAGRIPAAQITPLRRTLLMNHADRMIQEQARRLLGADRETPRTQVIAAYREALTQDADAERGRVVFIRECAACHKIGNTGHDVGPSLITVRHRTAADLLTQILDPNREAGQAFMQYAVALTDGRVTVGMIAEESAASVTIRKAENQQEVILRENIAEIRNTGLSLMPEGLEKKLSVPEVADLITFLKHGDIR